MELEIPLFCFVKKHEGGREVNWNPAVVEGGRSNSFFQKPFPPHTLLSLLKVYPCSPKLLFPLGRLTDTCIPLTSILTPRMNRFWKRAIVIEKQHKGRNCPFFLSITASIQFTPTKTVPFIFIFIVAVTSSLTFTNCHISISHLYAQLVESMSNRIRLHH